MMPNPFPAPTTIDDLINIWWVPFEAAAGGSDIVTAINEIESKLAIDGVARQACSVATDTSMDTTPSKIKIALYVLDTSVAKALSFIKLTSRDNLQYVLSPSENDLPSNDGSHRGHGSRGDRGNHYGGERPNSRRHRGGRRGRGGHDNQPSQARILASPEREPCEFMEPECDSQRKKIIILEDIQLVPPKHAEIMANVEIHNIQQSPPGDVEIDEIQLSPPRDVEIQDLKPRDLLRIGTSDLDTVPYSPDYLDSLDPVRLDTEINRALMAKTPKKRGIPSANSSSINPLID
ncbi:unnamed protein product [Parnassius apollo]|uniref:(apollo) hypothetical protein n=1 Tax=Parnassius apollo TaxID=110799 RepID=A0A8S3WEV0_PARAO|nr:unnamed protein product [Parnassius apollo]